MREGDERMFEFVVNDEVVLKLIDTNHADQLFELTDTCRPYLKEWLPWVDGSKSVEDVKAFIEMTKNQFISNNGFQAGILVQRKYCRRYRFS